MLSDKRLAIIGGGNMGEAMLKGLIVAQLIKPQQITFTDIIEARLGYLRDTYTVQALTDNVKAVAPADLIILAVKPQDITQTIQGIAPVVDDQKVVISIAAALEAMPRRQTWRLPVSSSMPSAGLSWWLSI